ncbi:unnamed protein product [Cuscuta epithymum]|uniref:Uncharacterized protein n=1 Tax=Cuscuta epithymum TaxID=186058 RepID=A0AAV0F3C9_9ASTE|nr:unnamed protein product [Cuscuta epithymum]
MTTFWFHKKVTRSPTVFRVKTTGIIADHLSLSSQACSSREVHKNPFAPDAQASPPSSTSAILRHKPRQAHPCSLSPFFCSCSASCTQHEISDPCGAVKLGDGVVELSGSAVDLDGGEVDLGGGYGCGMESDDWGCGKSRGLGLGRVRGWSATRGWEGSYRRCGGGKVGPLDLVGDGCRWLQWCETESRGH